MVVAFLVGIEALLYSAARSRQGRARKQQFLLGTSSPTARAIPLVDTYLRQKTVKSNRLQRLIAFKLAVVCRHAVHTRSFEYLLLHLVRTASAKPRNSFNNMKRRVIL